MLNVIFLFLEKLSRKISIQKEPNKTYNEPGSNVKLTCDVGNATFYAITWSKGDLTLIYVLRGPGKLTLELNPLSAHYLGTYTCKVFQSRHYYNSLSVTIQFKGILF